VSDYPQGGRLAAAGQTQVKAPGPELATQAITTPDRDALRSFVKQCAGLFVGPGDALAIADQAAANWEHWCRTGTLCVLVESEYSGIVEDGVRWTWNGEQGKGEKYHAVLPDGREGIVLRTYNGEWDWMIAIPGDLVMDDGSGADTYATREDAMRAILHPEDADPDRGSFLGRRPRTGLTYGQGVRQTR
jgi:hypothetical protein